MKITSIVKLSLLSVLFALFTDLACAQNVKVTGKVIDSATLKPAADASIYIANSTIGTKIGNDGSFIFPPLSLGNYTLIVSSVGYVTKQVEFTVGTNDIILNIGLKPRVIQLKEVAIRPNNNREQALNLFKKEFIGTADTKECKILNPEVIDLEYTNNRLTASTDQFLDIENNVLGYKLRFLVKSFIANYNDRTAHYTGTVIFEELTGTKSQQKKWAKNRLNTYNGSFTHFLISLSHNQLKVDKYVVRNLIKQAETKRITPVSSARAGRTTREYILPAGMVSLTGAPLTENDMMQTTTQPDVFALKFPGRLYVIYKNKRVTKQADDLHRFDEASNFQIAAMNIKNQDTPVLFTNKGQLLTNGNLFFEGEWNGRMLNLLPFDYIPDKVQ